MKHQFPKLFMLAAILCGTPALFAQKVDIPNRIYKVGDVITANISQFSGVMGVENDVKRLSEQKTVSGTATYDVGKATAPGQYLVRFKSGSFEKSILVFVLPGNTTHTTSDVVKTAQPVRGIPGKFMDNLMAFNKDQWKEANKKAFDKYLTNHAVSTTTTFLICVTAIVEPTLWIQCGTSSAGNAKDYAKLLLEESGAVMVANGKLTAAELNTIKNSIATAEFLFSLVQGFKIDGGKIKLNSLELLTGTTTYVTDLATTNEQLQAGASISTEFARKVDVLISISKK